VFSGEFKYLEGLNQRIKDIIRDVGDILAELPRSILVYNELQINIKIVSLKVINFSKECFIHLRINRK